MSTTVPTLEAGQRLDRAEFHRRYEATPPDARFELVDGIVIKRGWVTARHGSLNACVMYWLGSYKLDTPGVDVLPHVSTALDDRAEVHPDVLIRIKPDRGGQTFNLNGIVGGAPELVVEVSDSSPTIDLAAKLADYERAGVLEYVVFIIEPGEVYWHIRRHNRLVRVRPDPDGLYRSTTFPGLWLDPAAMLAEDGLALLATLERGLATPEHVDFAARLTKVMDREPA